MRSVLRMSYVPNEWAKSGGDFWVPKPAPALRSVVGKKSTEGEKKTQ